MTRADTVAVLGPAFWNHLVLLDALPQPVPHMEFALADHETLGGTSAGKALHLQDLGRRPVLHTVVGDDPVAALILGALTAADVDVRPVQVDGPSERHLNLMTGRGERLSIYLATAAMSRRPSRPAPARPREPSRARTSACCWMASICPERSSDGASSRRRSFVAEVFDMSANPATNEQSRRSALLGPWADE